MDTLKTVQHTEPYGFFNIMKMVSFDKNTVLGLVNKIANTKQHILHTFLSCEMNKNVLNHVYIKEFVTRAPFGFPAKSQDITHFSTLFFKIPKFLTKKMPF